VASAVAAAEAEPPAPGGGTRDLVADHLRSRWTELGRRHGEELEARQAEAQRAEAQARESHAATRADLEARLAALRDELTRREDELVAARRERDDEAQLLAAYQDRLLIRSVDRTFLGRLWRSARRTGRSS
jgi:hypothetical protein